MPDTPHLSPEEQANLDAELRRAHFEAEVRQRMGNLEGAEEESEEERKDTDEFVKDMTDIEYYHAHPVLETVGNRLGDTKLLTDEELAASGDVAAEIDKFLDAVEAGGVAIDVPETVSPTDFYRWLRDEFTKQELNMPASSAWTSHFIYTELVPLGTEAMDDTVTRVINNLFNLERDLDAFGFKRMAFTPAPAFRSYLPGAQGRYVAAWRAAIKRVKSFDYQLDLGELTGEWRARMSFQLTYTVVREDGSLDQHSGPGEALLSFGNPTWEISDLKFSGFHLRDDMQ